MGLYNSGSAPSPDPRIGEAAVMSAALGKDYLAFMKDQSKISNAWAAEDRDRSKTVFQPMEDAFIKEANTYDTPGAQRTAAREAVADVKSQAAMADDARRRDMARMGVDPRSGRAGVMERQSDMMEGLAAAGASNSARRQVRAEGRALRADAVNMGRGLAVNPATSLGLANGAMSSGFGGAMQGQAQMGNLLNTQYSQQMAKYNADQAASGSLMSGLGSLAGMAMFMSSKKVKKDKRPARGVLESLKKMPVEEWTYKDGAGDGGRHVGPYAEDFKRATGKGDGETIPVVDAIGVTMGAVKELSDKVDKLAGAKGGRKAPRSRGVMAEALA